MVGKNTHDTRPSSRGKSGKAPLTLDVSEDDAALGSKMRSIIKRMGTDEELYIGPSETKRSPSSKQLAVVPIRRYRDKRRMTKSRTPIQLDQVSPRDQDSQDQLIGVIELGNSIEEGRERGRARVAEILEGEEMYSAQDLARYFAVRRQTVNNRFKDKKIIGLDGPTRGLRYPIWQFSETGKPIEGLHEVISLVGDNSWSVYSYLMEIFPDGQGERVYEKLRQGETEAVLGYLQGVIGGDFT